MGYTDCYFNLEKFSDHSRSRGTIFSHKPKCLMLGVKSEKKGEQYRNYVLNGRLKGGLCHPVTCLGLISLNGGS